MATLSGSGRSGGKIVTKRQRRPSTPYDRPPAPPQPKSPNWLTCVILPATRRIASNAAKIISSVFDSDNSDDSSSSSSLSLSDTEAANDDNSFDEPHNLHGSVKDNGTPSEAMKCISEVHQLSSWKSETKHAIEKLLMQESYSREECDRLVQIINSRVVDSTVGGAEAGVSTDTADRTIHDDTDDLCGKAIVEAKKWLKHKKAGQSPLSDRADVSCGLKPIAVQHIDSEVGSPVDMAKIYMRSRPPWASPSAEHMELQTPSTLRSQLPREGTLFPVSDESLSSLKKRTSFASGSWNIQEEIRRVRLKATEDLLHSPSRRMDLSLFALSPRYGPDSSVANLIITNEGDKVNELTSLTEAKTINFSMNGTGIGSSNGGISDVEIGISLANDGVNLNPATLSFEQYEDAQAIKIADECAASVSSHPANLDIGIVQHDDPQSAYVNGSPVEEMRNLSGTHVEGLPTSQARFSAEDGAVYVHTQVQQANVNAVEGHEKENTTTNTEEKCELLSEASIEVPIMHETDCLASFSPSNSSMRDNDELPWMPTQTNSSKLPSLDAMVIKQEGKKMGRYNRRGKGRGK